MGSRLGSKLSMSQKFHHPLIYLSLLVSCVRGNRRGKGSTDCPLYSIDYERSYAADTQSTKEDSFALGLVGLLCDIEAAGSCLDDVLDSSIAQEWLACRM